MRLLPENAQAEQVMALTKLLILSWLAIVFASFILAALVLLVFVLPPTAGAALVGLLSALATGLVGGLGAVVGALTVTEMARRSNGNGTQG